MPLPSNLIKVTWNFELDGGLDNGGDIAQPSAWFWPDAGAPGDVQDALEGQSQTAYEAWASNFSDGSFPTSVVLVSVRTTLYNSGLIAQSVGEYAPTTKWAGTASASMPWQLTFCAGLYSFQPGTYTPNNRRKRGRMFLPPLATNQMQNGLRGVLGPSNVTGLLDSLAGCLADTRASTVWGPSGGEGAAGPQVVSRVDATIREALYLTGDQVLDTQRRRTNSESRTRVVKTITA